MNSFVWVNHPELNENELESPGVFVCETCFNMEKILLKMQRTVDDFGYEFDIDIEDGDVIVEGTDVDDCQLCGDEEYDD